VRQINEEYLKMNLELIFASEDTKRNIVDTVKTMGTFHDSELVDIVRGYVADLLIDYAKQKSIAFVPINFFRKYLCHARSFTFIITIMKVNRHELIDEIQTQFEVERLTIDEHGNLCECPNCWAYYEIVD
jgi:hypothetical protein